MKHSPDALRHLGDALAALDAEGLLRRRAEPINDDRLSYCSNDYLGLASRAAPPFAAGAGASRLVTGERDAHRQLENDVAEWLDCESALVFTSGYAANVGVLSALASAGDVIVSDALNHASIIDGARLSRAEISVVPHCDVAAIERALAAPRRGRAWVVTESYFSMDADGPDLAHLRAVCDATGAALIVDEAHALGVLGPQGKGLCAEARIVPDVLVGTFGKSFGAGGAFVAGSANLTSWLWNRARSFVFSTGLSPALAEAARRALSASVAEPWRREAVLRAAALMRSALSELGVKPAGFGPIIPWIVGSPQRAQALAFELRARHVDVAAIRPPSVPAGSSRLRLTVTARHTQADIASAIVAIAEALRCVDC